MHDEPHREPSPDAERDPVCGMSVDAAKTPHHAAHDGRDFHFCGARCRTRFVDDPAAFLRPASAAAPTDPAAEYTCPMHPEIVQIGPGACPICGMDLEPRHVLARETRAGKILKVAARARGNGKTAQCGDG